MPIKLNQPVIGTITSAQFTKIGTMIKVSVKFDKGEFEGTYAFGVTTKPENLIGAKAIVGTQSQLNDLVSQLAGEYIFLPY